MQTATKNETRGELTELVGKYVRVTCNEHGVLPGSGFPTGLMVGGKLEGHPGDPDAFRVLVNDDTYAYFRTEDVDMVNPIATVTTIVIRVEMKE